jgi:hypothetical protein
VAAAVSVGQLVVARLRGLAWRLLLPTPQSIALSVVRGGGLGVDVAGVAAGATRTWRDSIVAAEEGVLVVLAHVSVEHGALGNVLAGEPDTNVELAVSVDGARIGRSVVEVRQGAAEVASCTAAIRVAPGLRRVSASLHPYDAGLKVGDHSVVSLFVPETMAGITVA